MSVTERFRGRQGGTLADLSRPSHRILTGETEIASGGPGRRVAFGVCGMSSWQLAPRQMK